MEKINLKNMLTAAMDNCKALIIKEEELSLLIEIIEENPEDKNYLLLKFNDNIDNENINYDSIKERNIIYVIDVDNTELVINELRPGTLCSSDLVILCKESYSENDLLILNRLLISGHPIAIVNNDVRISEALNVRESKEV